MAPRYAAYILLGVRTSIGAWNRDYTLKDISLPPPEAIRIYQRCYRTSLSKCT